ncbi:MAG: hypothetical protein OHK0036_10340 [Bacteroidia bacterium]
MVILVALSIIMVVLIFSQLNKYLKKKSAQKQLKIMYQKIQDSYEKNEITKEQANLLESEVKKNWNYIDIDKRIEKLKKLNQKYGEEIANKLSKHEYWIGMSVEQLIDAKGQPNKIENHALKTKTKTIYIYGNKSSGDVFVIEDGVVTKITDR